MVPSDAGHHENNAGNLEIKANLGVGVAPGFYAGEGSRPINKGLTSNVVEKLSKTSNTATCRFFGVGPGGTKGRRASELGADPEVVTLWLARYRESEASGG